MIHVQYGSVEIMINPALESRSDSGHALVNYQLDDLIMAVYMAIGPTRFPAADFASGLINTALRHGQNPGGTQQ